MSTVEASDHDYYNDTIAFAPGLQDPSVAVKVKTGHTERCTKAAKRSGQCKAGRKEGKSEEQAPLHCV